MFIDFDLKGLFVWAQLFKALLVYNEVVNQGLVKASFTHKIKYANIFALKLLEAFCIAKAHHIYSVKI